MGCRFLCKGMGFPEPHVTLGHRDKQLQYNLLRRLAAPCCATLVHLLVLTNKGGRLSEFHLWSGQVHPEIEANLITYRGTIPVQKGCLYNVGSTVYLQVRYIPLAVRYQEAFQYILLVRRSSTPLSPSPEEIPVRISNTAN